MKLGPNQHEELRRELDICNRTKADYSLAAFAGQACPVSGFPRCNAKAARGLKWEGMNRGNHHRLISSGLLALLVVCLAGVPQANGDPARPGAGADGAEAAVPFRAGEKLDYRVGWQNFLTAATAQVRVEARRPFYGRAAWHFQATARTVEPVRYLYTLDDQFDSYSDTVSLASLQYETYLREMGGREDTRIRMSADGEAESGDGPSVRVPPGTRDPLGTFFSLRAVDWEQTTETKMYVYDGKKLYELRARKMGAAETVTVPAGEFSATCIEMRVYERNRELTSTRFLLWLATDRARTPVLVEAELPFGSFRVELTRIQ